MRSSELQTQGFDLEIRVSHSSTVLTPIQSSQTRGLTNQGQGSNNRGKAYITDAWALNTEGV